MTALAASESCGRISSFKGISARGAELLVEDMMLAPRSQNGDDQSTAAAAQEGLGAAKQKVGVKRRATSVRQAAVFTGSTSEATAAAAIAAVDASSRFMLSRPPVKAAAGGSVDGTAAAASAAGEAGTLAAAHAFAAAADPAASLSKYGNKRGSRSKMQRLPYRTSAEASAVPPLGEAAWAEGGADGTGSTSRASGGVGPRRYGHGAMVAWKTAPE